ncbi:uncharacterized protein SAPINGB_P003613 [Magnusiomyces paraingens]|uniref:Transcription factor domain-containing protein n=1 Tax=Magnusiomyces paraingens TaxID=2606893 RepID=A0A5E8BVM6_9ASCO|nr:uncharacterized protein SAPINGB_P003613 [Saprochaete ingens]VVT53517.1 unnamed protein product [Saprochaete ingens]
MQQKLPEQTALDQKSGAYEFRLPSSSSTLMQKHATPLSGSNLPISNHALGLQSMSTTSISHKPPQSSTASSIKITNPIVFTPPIISNATPSSISGIRNSNSTLGFQLQPTHQQSDVYKESNIHHTNYIEQQKSHSSSTCSLSHPSITSTFPSEQHDSPFVTSSCSNNHISYRSDNNPVQLSSIKSPPSNGKLPQIQNPSQTSLTNTTSFAQQPTYFQQQHQQYQSLVPNPLIAFDNIQKPPPLPLSNNSAPTNLTASIKNLTYASTSPSIIKVFGYIKPVISLIIEKCPGYSDAIKLKELLDQSDSYISFLRAQKKNKGSRRMNSTKSRLSVSSFVSGEEKKGFSESLEVLYPNLVTYNLAQDSIHPSFIPSSSNVTEEQMLQCVGCYFLAYHSIYPIFEPNYWYKFAKKIWRNMEYGVGNRWGLLPNHSQLEGIEVAIIYILVALGSQECSRNTIFSGISSLDWARCYFTRAMDIMGNNLDEFPSSVRLAQFSVVASLFESISLHEKKAALLVSFSLKTCERLNLRVSGTALNELEKRKADPDYDLKTPMNPALKYPPNIDLFDGHRVFIVCYLWARLIGGLQENFMPHNFVNFSGSPDLNNSAFESIGFNNVEALRKRVDIQDLLNQVIDYATSMYFVEDPINSVGKIEQTIKEVFSLADPNIDGDAMDIDLNQYNLSIHFNFASGHGGLSPTSAARLVESSSSAVSKEDMKYSVQLFTNEQLAQKTKRWFRTHFVALYKFTRMLLYRPFPIASLLFQDEKYASVISPVLLDFFSSGSMNLFNIISEVYTEMIYPKIRRHRERKNLISPLNRENCFPIDKKDETEEEDFGMFDICISNIASELSVAIFLFFGLSKPSKRSQNSNENIKKTSESEKIRESAIKSFVGCIEFMISEQEEIDLHNMKANDVCSTYGISQDTSQISPPLLSSRQITTSSLSTSLNKTFSSTSISSATSSSTALGHGEVNLIPSPLTELMYLLSKMIQNSTFLDLLASEMSDFDYLKIAKWLLSKQPSPAPPTPKSSLHSPTHATVSGVDISLKTLNPYPEIKQDSITTSGTFSESRNLSQQLASHPIAAYSVNPSIICGNLGSVVSKSSEISSNNSSSISSLLSNYPSENSGFSAQQSVSPELPQTDDLNEESKSLRSSISSLLSAKSRKEKKRQKDKAKGTYTENELKREKNYGNFDNFNKPDSFSSKSIEGGSNQSRFSITNLIHKDIPISMTSVSTVSHVNEALDHSNNQTRFAKSTAFPTSEREGITPQLSTDSSSSGHFSNGSSSGTDSYFNNSGGKHQKRSKFYGNPNSSDHSDLSTPKTDQEQRDKSENDDEQSGFIVHKEEDEDDFRLLWKKIVQLFV